MRKILSYILLVLILLFPTLGLADDCGEKTILLMLDELSIKEIESLDAGKYSIGLVNIKTRRPYGPESFYLSLNTGRKTSSIDSGKRKDLIYLKDILTEEKMFYIGDKDSRLKYLLADGDSRLDYSNLKPSEALIDEILATRDILALELEFKRDYRLIASLIRKNGSRNIYIIPRSLEEGSQLGFNKFLLPVIKAGPEAGGILSSDSTRRRGFIALEDIQADIVDGYGLYKEEDIIGRPLINLKSSQPLEELSLIYKENINILILAYIFHGLVYISMGLLLLGLLYGSFEKFAHKFLFFAMNNVVISLVLALTGAYRNLIIYLALAGLLNLALVHMSKYIKNLGLYSIYLSYGLIVYGNIFNKSIIYNSYMGFNNLFYGARFYGLNNGIAAILLAASLIVVDGIYNWELDHRLRKFLILCLPLINVLNLSTSYGANTGAFISSIFLVFIVYYYYLFKETVKLRTIILFLGLGLAAFALNIYMDSFGQASHASRLFIRIRENGPGEFISMAKFKLEELIRLSLLPPFSLVMASQTIYLARSRSRQLRIFRAMVLTGLVGFIINDTGNILLIYVLAYLIFYLNLKKDRDFKIS